MANRRLTADKIYLELRSAVQNAAMKYTKDKHLSFTRCMQIQQIAIPFITTIVNDIATKETGYADSVDLNVFAMCEYHPSEDKIVYLIAEDDYNGVLKECDIETFAYHICVLSDYSTVD